MKPGRKDQVQSQKYREAGNKKYGSGSPDLALHLYTDAVLAAPDGQPELSLALANRSAALHQMKKFRSALQDIDMALMSGYPQVER